MTLASPKEYSVSLSYYDTTVQDMGQIFQNMIDLHWCILG